MAVEWGPDGDDLTVPQGAMAKPSRYGVKDGSRCTVQGCVARDGMSGHARAFRHVSSPNRAKPKPRYKTKGDVYAKALKVKREGHAAKAMADGREPYPVGVLVAQKAGLVVYSRAPWAWALDRKGFPKALEA
jgi:hypothetical protein